MVNPDYNEALTVNFASEDIEGALTRGLRTKRRFDMLESIVSDAMMTGHHARKH